MFTTINQSVFAFVNGYAGQNALLDAFVLELMNNHIFKGVIVAMVLVALWASHGDRPEQRRTGVISTILISMVGIFIGRLLAKTLPFSLRPINTPDLVVNIPIGSVANVLEGWSSMPSDHAVMYFALATSIFLISHWVGAFLFVHAAIVVSLTRVFAGVHWPLDVVVGAAIGISTALVLHKPMTRMLTRFDVVGLVSHYSVIAYPTLFFVLLQIGTMYEPLRRMLSTSLFLVQTSIAGG
ncbi:MAG: phosphatase PAP2 family protein [Proteobacteria bacterium]|nr:phosphatase PAP2 family protein [Pseudomonadota bacterium]